MRLYDFIIEAHTNAIEVTIGPSAYGPPPDVYRRYMPGDTTFTWSATMPDRADVEFLRWYPHEEPLPNGTLHAELCIDSMSSNGRVSGTARYVKFVPHGASL